MQHHRCKADNLTKEGVSRSLNMVRGAVIITTAMRAHLV
jgi:hypothetical protein